MTTTQPITDEVTSFDRSVGTDKYLATDAERDNSTYVHSDSFKGAAREAHRSLDREYSSERMRIVSVMNDLGDILLVKTLRNEGQIDVTIIS